MTAYSSGPVHKRSTYRRPMAYRSTMAVPLRRPRLVILRSSCGHFLGVGYAWRSQGFITWKACR